MVFQIYGNIMSCDMIKIFKRKKYNKVQYEKLFYFVYLMALQNVKKNYLWPGTCVWAKIKNEINLKP